MYNEECLYILRKLHNQRKYGAAHTPEWRVKSWALGGMYGNPDKIRTFEKSYKELIRQEILIKQLKNGSMHIWLNPKKAAEIANILELNK